MSARAVGSRTWQVRLLVQEVPVTRELQQLALVCSAGISSVWVLTARLFNHWDLLDTGLHCVKSVRRLE